MISVAWILTVTAAGVLALWWLRRAHQHMLRILHEELDHD